MKKEVQAKTFNLEKGDRIRIEGLHLKVDTGTVITANHYEREGWYIEITWDQAVDGMTYGYYKQAYDGGQVIKLS